MAMEHKGLTLIESVVSTVCLSLLLSLTIPAIQHCREGSDLEICANNLRGIGVAATAYDETEMMLPPYMGLPYPPENCDIALDLGTNYQLTYPVTQLLAYLGYVNLVEQVDPFAFSNENLTIHDVGYASFGEWLFGIDKTQPGISSISFNVAIPELRCPSDPVSATSTIFFGFAQTELGHACSYYISAMFIPPDWSYRNHFSLTNYCASAGAIAVTANASNLSGPIQSRSALAINEIPDGASNVVIFGESVAEISSFTGRHSLAMGGMAVGDATIYAAETVFGNLDDSKFYQFGSGHPKSVNFLFADGSVRNLSRGISPELMGRYCGASDGDPVFGVDK